MSLPCRSIWRRRFDDEATTGKVREDRAIREDRVTNPGEVRVRLEAQWQASRRVDGVVVVVVHIVRGKGVAVSGKGIGGWVKLAPSPGIEPGSSP